MFAKVLDIKSNEYYFLNSVDELIEYIEKFYDSNKSFKTAWNELDSFKKTKYILFSGIKDCPLEGTVLNNIFKIKVTDLDIESLIKLANYFKIDEKEEYESVDGTITTNLNVLSNILGIWTVWNRFNMQYIKMKENIGSYAKGKYPYYDSLDTDPFYFMN